MEDNIQSATSDAPVSQERNWPETTLQGTE